MGYLKGKKVILTIAAKMELIVSGAI